ncbi:sensor histidine kinase [Kitasatospora sp. MAP5-34]|uniref:sensor histidine kinase n=1 Tax=Kitasatospora sp. MAP5-34 TaxID=3035102 RepID=UPI0024736D6B|nr:sensor histidine kinase [Kitasatospora sp. MAP5-34]MDH6580358.1 two-component system sensor histidine kinase DesK [Kitasatospora sp. MAP5-34]
MGVKGPVKRWRGLAKPQRIEAYNRWSMYVLTVVGPFGLLPLLAKALAHSRSWVLPALVAALLLNSAVSVVLFRTGIAHYLGRRSRPTGWLAAGSAVTLAVVWGSLLLGPHKAGSPPATAIPAALLLLLWFASAGVVMPPRYTALTGAALLALAYPPLAIACESGGTALGILTSSLFGYMSAAASCRCSVWMTSVAWELDTAREAQSRLAVAEERLRFSRDLHDVLGRNLTTIALKSELAAQLARRGRPEAVDQMTEVQRIAQESHREVREVVRGYRTADLPAEVAGARSVLRAADVVCEIDLGPDGTELPPAVQSVFGWVVREATTNVLRHSEARHCSVSLRLSADRAVLEVTNDGVPTDRASRTSGSGLAGLRERLAAHGGELAFPRAAPGSFRLTAALPLTATALEPSTS